MAAERRLGELIAETVIPNGHTMLRLGKSIVVNALIEQAFNYLADRPRHDFSMRRGLFANKKAEYVDILYSQISERIKGTGMRMWLKTSERLLQA